MMYDGMPLYPSIGRDRGEACLRVPVFDADRGPGAPPDVRQCRRVTLENPCRPGEFAEVQLGLDGCGNLVVCVHRRPGPNWDCNPCPGRPPRCGDGKGRLYGSWR